LRESPFIENSFYPYLKEIFNDLLWRDSENEMVGEGQLSRFTFKEVRALNSSSHSCQALSQKDSSP